MTTQPTTHILDSLVRLFYHCVDDLGDFVEVQADAMPADYRALLAHQNHMTVTVERYHHSPVDVRVLETHISGEHYARKILLSRQSDGVVVQFGIVRLNFAHVDPEVRREVESQQIPLGRVLIAHNVLREIHLLGCGGSSLVRTCKNCLACPATSSSTAARRSSTATASRPSSCWKSCRRSTGYAPAMRRQLPESHALALALPGSGNAPRRPARSPSAALGWRAEAAWPGNVRSLGAGGDAAGPARLRLPCRCRENGAGCGRTLVFCHEVLQTADDPGTLRRCLVFHRYRRAWG